MKKVFVVSLAVLAIFSCTREQFIDLPEETPYESLNSKVNLTIIADNPSDADTRTQMNGMEPWWSIGDQLGVSSLTPIEYPEMIDYPFSWLSALEQDLPGATATFTGTLREDYQQDKSFYAWYPAAPTFRIADVMPDYETSSSCEMGEYFYFNSLQNSLLPGISYYPIGDDPESDEEALGALVLVSGYQRPSATSFDGASDVLATGSFSLSGLVEGDGGEVPYSATVSELQFYRLVSVVKLVIDPGTKPFAGQHPKSVNFYYRKDDVETYLSGPAVLTFPGAENENTVPVLYPIPGIDGPGASPEVNAILNGYTLSANDNAIYLLVFPQILKSGGELTVCLEDSENYYSIFRSIVLNRDIALNPGKMTTLNVSFDKNDVEASKKNTPAELTIDVAPQANMEQYDPLTVEVAVSGEDPEDEYVFIDREKLRWVLTDGEGTETTYTLDDNECDYKYDGTVLYFSLQEVEPYGSMTLTVYYGEGNDALSASCSFEVHQAVELPSALGGDWRYSFNDDYWFQDYRKVRDGHVYLKTWKASQPESLPRYPFYHAFKSDTEEGDFSAFKYFKNLTTISELAFFDCEQMTGIVLPDKVKEIGVKAFKMNGKLANVTLSADLETIGEEAFSDCYRLCEIVLPAKLKYIGLSAFYDCGFKSVSIPASVTTIEAFAFYSSSLQYVIMEEREADVTLPVLGDYAFWGSATIVVPDNAYDEYVAAWGGDYTIVKSSLWTPPTEE